MNQTMYYLRKRLWLATHKAGKETSEVIIPTKDWRAIRSGKNLTAKAPEIPNENDWTAWARDLAARHPTLPRNSQRKITG